MRRWLVCVEKRVFAEGAPGAVRCAQSATSVDMLGDTPVHILSDMPAVQPVASVVVSAVVCARVCARADRKRESVCESLGCACERV